MLIYSLQCIPFSTKPLVFLSKILINPDSCTISISYPFSEIYEQLLKWDKHKCIISSRLSFHYMNKQIRITFRLQVVFESTYHVWKGSVKNSNTFENVFEICKLDDIFVIISCIYFLTLFRICIEKIDQHFLAPIARFTFTFYRLYEHTFISHCCF